MQKEIVTDAATKQQELDQILKQFNIDTNQWQVSNVAVNRWESVTAEGNKIPMYQTKVNFKPIYSDLDKDIIEDLKKDLKEYSPSRKILPKRLPRHGQLMLEIPLKDIHFGKLCWDEETGENYNLEIAKRKVTEALDHFIQVSSPFADSITTVLLEIGNDFFNSDTKLNTTTSGTPQIEADRWRKIFKEGRQLIVEVIDRLNEIAPVHVLVVPGNHDEQRTFFLGDAIECWYHNNPDVYVNNRASKRKYFQFFNSLIGFTHGDQEKHSDLAQIMATECKKEWANAKYKEWHIGHFHKERVISDKDVVIRTIASLSPADDWHFSKGYIGNTGAQAFIWHEEKGNILSINFNE